MHKFLIAGACAGVILILATPVSADEPVKGSEIVVTATRTAHTAEKSLSTVVVISREDIELSQAQDVADLLRFNAGLEIGRNGGPGQNTSIFIRGAESNHTLVLVDGVRINPGTLGTASVQNINPDMIERIEIIKGPRSTLFGTDAIGGVVNIITRKNTKGNRITGSVMAGSFETSSANGGWHSQKGDWRSGIGLSGFKTTGFPARTTGTSNSGHNNTSVLAYAGSRVSSIDTEVRLWQNQGRTEYFDFSVNPVSQNYTNNSISLLLNSSPSESSVSKFHISYFSDLIDQNDSNDYAHTNRTTVDWQNDFQLNDNNLLTAGLVDSRQTARALSFGSQYREQTISNAAFIQHQWQKDSQELLAGGRFTRHSGFGDYVTGSLAYGNQLNKNWRVVASYGTGFRAPDATDRFGYGGNAALLPETSANTELGLRYRISENQRTNLTLFRNNINNLILYDTGTSKNLNIEKARIDGVEAQWLAQFGSWSIDAKAVVQDPLNLTTNKPLARRASYNGTLGLRYKTPRYKIGLDLLDTGSRRDSDYNTIINAAYTLVNLTGQYALGKNWTLEGKIENLLNTQYVLANTYNTPDRSYFLRLKYQAQN